MPASFFLVRAVVAEPLRNKFDHWYSADHLPWAIRNFKCEKAWRFWSEVEPGVHYAVYRFADKAACDAALGSEAFKELVADFTRTWPEGVTRTRDIVTLWRSRRRRRTDRGRDLASLSPCGRGWIASQTSLRSLRKLDCVR